MILYFDVVLIINLIMNYVILYLVALILNKEKVYYRLFLGAMLGCIFLIGMVYPKFAFLTKLPSKIILSIAMVFLSFSTKNIRDFLKTISFLYIISFMMGGGVLAFFFLLNLKESSLIDTIIFNSISVPWWILLISAFTVFVFLKYIWPIIYRILAKDALLVLITIVLDEKSTEVTALIDTGNDLFDPISNYPVIIVELSAIKSIFSMDLDVMFKEGMEGNLEAISKLAANSKWANRFRLIPFESIGRNKGLMLGFKPDSVTIKYNKKILTTKDAVIGVYQKTLSQEGTYRALLNPVLIN